MYSYVVQNVFAFMNCHDTTRLNSYITVKSKLLFIPYVRMFIRVIIMGITYVPIPRVSCGKYLHTTDFQKREFDIMTWPQTFSCDYQATPIVSSSFLLTSLIAAHTLTSIPRTRVCPQLSGMTMLRLFKIDVLLVVFTVQASKRCWDVDDVKSHILRSLFHVQRQQRRQ